MKSTNRGSQARKSPFTSPLISQWQPRTRLLGAWDLASAVGFRAAWEYPWSSLILDHKIRLLDRTGLGKNGGLEKVS
jgi:hypothetical protein